MGWAFRGADLGKEGRDSALNPCRSSYQRTLRVGMSSMRWRWELIPGRRCASPARALTQVEGGVALGTSRERRERFPDASLSLLLRQVRRVPREAHRMAPAATPGEERGACMLCMVLDAIRLTRLLESPDPVNVERAVRRSRTLNPWVGASSALVTVLLYCHQTHACTRVHDSAMARWEWRAGCVPDPACSCAWSKRCRVAVWVDVRGPGRSEMRATRSWRAPRPRALASSRR